MSRRTLLGVMACSVLGSPLAARGQEVREVKIGLLTERSVSSPHVEALRRGLMELGWADGSFRIEQRSAEGNLERLPGLAAELITVCDSPGGVMWQSPAFSRCWPWPW